MLGVDFNSRFFLASAILSLFTGVSYRFYTWLHYLRIIEFPIPWLWLIVEPAKLFFGVFLPFAVMYVLATREKPRITTSLLITVFLGCWLGQLVAIAMDTFLAYPNGVSDLLQFTLIAAWETFASLFSITLFVNMTAILLVYYRKQQDERSHPSPE